jgi:hypothetical protein
MKIRLPVILLSVNAKCYIRQLREIYMASSNLEEKQNIACD